MFLMELHMTPVEMSALGLFGISRPSVSFVSTNGFYLFLKYNHVYTDSTTNLKTN